MTSTAEKLAENEKPAPEKRKALGRGLESLLPSGPRAVVPGGGSPATVAEAGGHSPHSTVLPEVFAQAAGGLAVSQIALDQIEHNPYQTRYNFDEEALQELAESIRANGVVQPIVVRPGADGRYLLILGERLAPVQVAGVAAVIVAAAGSAWSSGEETAGDGPK